MKKKIDPRLLSVIRYTYENIADHAAIALLQSAWNPIISLSRDFACCLLDSDFRLITGAREVRGLGGLFTLSMPGQMQKMAEFFEGEIYDGDIIMSNDCDLGNTHNLDIAIIRPIFHEGKIMFWSGSRGHFADIGAPGGLGANAYAKDAYGEGLTITPMKIFEKGKIKKEFLNLLLNNVRFSMSWRGDLMAYVGFNLVAAHRIKEFIKRYGKVVIKKYTQELVDYTDRLVTAEIRKMKPGTYYGEDWIDTNAYGTHNIPVKVKLTIGNDMLVADFSETGPALIGSCNCSLGVVEGAVANCLALMVDPEIPKNWGLTKHTKAVAPEGCLVNAKRPAACGMATTTTVYVVMEAIFRAAAAANPERISAGYGRPCLSQFTGTDFREGRNAPWWYTAVRETAGGGAAYGVDGYRGAMFPGGGGMNADPLEMVEWLYPILVNEYEIATDSMGAGKWRGAAGPRYTLTPYDCSTVDVSSFHSDCYNVTCGVVGGRPTPGGCVYDWDPQNPKKRTFHSSISEFYLKPGTSRTTIVSGGGGYGDALERDPALVSNDARDAIISLAAAREEYGVVLDPKTYVIDYDATEELRSKLKRERRKLPLVTPTESGTAMTRRRMMTEKDEWVDHDRSPGAFIE
jgi:N-methylhydantoinase B